MDFFKVRHRKVKGIIEIYPEFVVKPSKDLMVRGKNFYAIWDDVAGMWNQNEYRVQEIVDEEIRQAADKFYETAEPVAPLYLENFSSKMWTSFCNYISSSPDNYHQLDSKLTFANTEAKKTDYISRRLPYALEKGDHSAFDEMLGTLYSETELEKLLWAIGSIVSGDSVKIQKFIALYGDPGAGKGTFIDIINMLFEGYTVALDVEALTSRGDAFATDVFRNNPLVGFQQDTDLSRIDKNTTFNSIISHEIISMKQKYKDSFNARANCFIFVGSNEPVKITNGKSGLLRRLIDVTPSGRKIPSRRYHTLKNRIKFELGAIAEYCLRFYMDRGPDFYDDYRPINMQFKTDPFFNFVDYNRFEFQKEDGVSLKAAYTMYKEYIKEGGGIQLQMYKFKEELKNYFANFEDVARIDGKQIRSWYSGFLVEKFTGAKKKPEAQPELAKRSEQTDKLVLDKTESLLDILLNDCPAQYANEEDKPKYKWVNVKTKLRDIDTRKVHYIRIPQNHIVIDFDLKDADGNKIAALNLAAAAKWPPTYAEFSKGGAGVHLHYIYTGDVADLSNSYADGIEIKVFTGNASLRRRLSYCNDIPVSVISGGLPRKEGRRLLNEERLKSEKSLRYLIERNLRKEIHPGTKPSIDFIDKILSDAYESGLKYDVSDMQQKVLAFAMHSTNQAPYCIKKVGSMKWKSEEPAESAETYEKDIIVFFDCEVFPNLLVVCWKIAGPDNKVVSMINPSPADIEQLLKYKLIGFNCRRYDNHILYARLIGKTNEEIYKISTGMINDHRKSAFFGEAYTLSYTDILDFCSTKQSLKKWEIELGIHHQELGMPWDQPVPEDQWIKVADYCKNDVIATEAVFDANQADWTARQILADIAGMTVNDTTNSLTTRIIFGKEREPQSVFNYRNMGDETVETGSFIIPDDFGYPEFTRFDKEGRPIFPGYLYEKGVSTYRGEEVGEGGYVYSEPGVYHNVALLDIASMHPSSIVAENLFGPYTDRFKALLDIRVAIKHKEFEKARAMLDEKLASYLQDEKQAKQLSKALKIAINSVYGLTSAKFDNPFHDPRNIDNIVAKRGALFMINLKHEVQNRGFRVAHIKTDSIKIPDATPEIINFVMDYGRLYGYTFEHEAVFEKLCLVDKAQYVAMFATPELCNDIFGYVPEENAENTEKLTEHPGRWTVTGDCFRTLYTFKTLFSHESIEFKDLCETKTVTTALYLDMNEDLPQLSKDEEKLLDRMDKVQHSDDPEDLNKFCEKQKMTPEEFGSLYAELCKKDHDSHNYIFIGRAGSFCPMQDGVGAGWLMREKDGAYYSATGAKDYRWLEAEVVKTLGLEYAINHEYFRKQVRDVVKNMEDAAQKTNSSFALFMEEAYAADRVSV